MAKAWKTLLEERKLNAPFHFEITNLIVHAKFVKEQNSRLSFVIIKRKLCSSAKMSIVCWLETESGKEGTRYKCFQRCVNNRAASRLEEG